MIINFKKIKNYIDNGYVNIQKYPNLNIYILKYTKKTVYDNFWDNITLMCRGLWVNKDGLILARPFDKFFNYNETFEENNYLLRKNSNTKYICEEKLDGSLIIVSIVDKDIVISSSGSFTSEQVVKAKELLYSNGYDKFIESGKTYLFEIIYKNNRIVISYGDMESLTLLGIRDTETGEYLPIDTRFNCVKKVSMTLTEIEKEINENKFINKEGYIVKFEDGHMVKMKYLEYFRYHKLFTGINEKLIWKYLSEGKNLLEEVSNVPDELFDFITKTENKLKKAYQGIAIAHRVTFSDYNCDDRKEFADRIKNLDSFSKSILFAMKSDKDYKSIIWESIKPKVEGIINFGEKFNESI